MLRQVRNSTDYDVMNAHKLGAKMCPNCRTIIHTSIHLKMIAHNTRFVEIVCKNCNREAASEASATAARAIKQAIDGIHAGQIFVNT